MEHREILAKLATLTERERDVLRLRCQGHKYVVVARLLKPPIGDKGVRTHMHNIYVKLGLNLIENKQERRQLLLDVFCPALTEPLPVPEQESEPDHPQPRLLPAPRSVMPLVIDDDDLVLVKQTAIVPVNKKAEIVGLKEEVMKSRNSWAVLLIGLLLGAVLMLGATYVLGMFTEAASNSPLPLSPGTEETSTAVVITKIVTVTEAVRDVTPNVIVVTATSLPATATLEPTEVPPFPTDTPLPTLTPTAAVALPFEDDFNDGYDPRWKILSGDPIVSGGWLSTTEDGVTLQIGDKSWGNYTVDFDYITYNCPSLRLIVAQTISYYFCLGKWENFEENEWNELRDGPAPPDEGHARLVVSSSTYTMFINETQLFDINYGSPLSGPFAIFIGHPSAAIDNIRITSP